MSTKLVRMLPTLYLSHGGGPGFFMKVDAGSPFADISKDSEACRAMKEIGANRPKYGLPEDPAAIVVISAHWEEYDGFHVYSPEKTRLYYDYYGFPSDTYQLKYPVPGTPSLATRVVDMINSAQLPQKAVLDDDREGFDHGVFLPLMLLYPEAKCPIVQVSLHSSLDVNLHLALGKALAPLRNENVLIVGSGQITHPMGPGCTAQKTSEFVELVQGILTNPSLKDEERLKSTPSIFRSKLVRETHIPRSEHLTPLAVAVGAAEGALGQDMFRRGRDFRFMNGMFSLACYLFGANATSVGTTPDCKV